MLADHGPLLNSGGGPQTPPWALKWSNMEFSLNNAFHFVMCFMHIVWFTGTFPHGLVIQVGQLLAVQGSVSVGRLILSQAAADRVLTAPRASCCWQLICLCFQPLPHEAEHLDHSDTSHLIGWQGSKYSDSCFKMSNSRNNLTYLCNC